MASQQKKAAQQFYKVAIGRIREGENFYPEFVIFQKTVEAINSFNSLYKVGRQGKKGGPSTHAQQDLYRAMLVFACAGLDVLVKQLIKTKLVRLIDADKAAKEKFKDYIKNRMGKNEKEVLNVVALALVDQNPKEIFLKEYISSMTEDSLQSVPELMRVTTAACLDVKNIFTSDRVNRLKDAFHVRNQIIHEMDISVNDGTARTSGSRTRRQRVSRQMEAHTKQILDLAQEILSAFSNKFVTLKIDVDKASVPGA
jgi:hypothetical protein